MIYLDAAATTLIKPRSVAAAVKRAVNTFASPGRGGYRASMLAAEEAFLCREAAARLFGVKNPERVVFTMNATHALNIAIRALVTPGSRVLISGYEHNSVTRVLNALNADVIITRSELFEPEVAVFEFERRLKPGVSCVVCNHASNVFGYILPAERIAQTCREKGVPVIIDASQSAGSASIDFDSFGADFMAMPGHKGLYGPQGTGILLCASESVRGIMQGGTGSDSLIQSMPDFLPDALEAGTHNMPGIAGLRAGIEYVLSRGVRDISEHERKLIRLAERELAVIPGVRVYGGGFDYCRAGTLAFVTDSADCETVGERLAELGFAVRAGLHCAPEAHRTVGTLSTGAVRASVSAFTTRRDILKFISAVKYVVNSL